jgi:hypothetical protein
VPQGLGRRARRPGWGSGAAPASGRDQAAIDQVVARYQFDIDFATIPTLAEQHHLRLG